MIYIIKGSDNLATCIDEQAHCRGECPNWGCRGRYNCGTMGGPCYGYYD